MRVVRLWWYSGKGACGTEKGFDLVFTKPVDPETANEIGVDLCLRRWGFRIYGPTDVPGSDPPFLGYSP